MAPQTIASGGDTARTYPPTWVRVLAANYVSSRLTPLRRGNGCLNLIWHADYTPGELDATKTSSPNVHYQSRPLGPTLIGPLPSCVGRTIADAGRPAARTTGGYWISHTGRLKTTPVLSTVKMVRSSASKGEGLTTSIKLLFVSLGQARLSGGTTASTQGPYIRHLQLIHLHPLTTARHRWASVTAVQARTLDN